MEKKVRFKLHKVKKHWVTLSVAAVALAGIVGGAPASVSAESVTTDNDTTTTLVSDESTTVESVTEETVSTTEAATTDEAAAEASVVSETTTTSEASTETTVSETAETTSEETTTAATTATEATTTASEAASATVSEQEKEAALSLSNIKLVDGKYYYVQEDGSYKTNFAITVDGQLLYFDETGALTSASTYSFTQGLTNLTDAFTSNNRAYDSTEASFELIDGYLTADSWYRPTEILENGTTWVASTESDFRPLLMAWWPDVDTQVSYLNYMSDYFGLDTTYTADQEQVVLNTAVKAIQVKIEQKITAQATTDWLREVISSFVTTQDKWNMTSETPNSDHLQKGALLYVNSDLTEWANSDYRLLNRTPTNQTGDIKYTVGNDNGGLGGYEFLLSNDIDNSNPVVQAEMLNQLYYLMNWGTIVFGDDTANFDGVRVDAVDNVDADMLQLYTNLFKAAYGIDETEANALAHISILEAWSHNDPYYNYDTNGGALAMDNGLRLSLLYALTRPITSETGGETRTAKLDDIINGGYYGLVDRSNVTSYDDTGKASYIFVRAHDSEVQTVIANIISKYIDPTTDGFTFTLDQLKQAFAIYNEDMNSVDKKFTHYNIPAAYAIMLQNMGQATRVYYGDLYTDNGQYMETESPYHEQITTLLEARSKYVAGGQTSYVDYLDATATVADGSTAATNNGVYVSVRYGQDLMSATDTEGGQYGRNSGMLTIVSNNPDLELKEDAVLKVNMGAAHTNQAYRPLIIGTENGIVSSLNDSDTTLVKTTDADGYLYFTADEIKGFSTVDMSGFVAVWVPVGAAEDQYVLASASTEQKAEGEQIYQASAALEAQVIYEGFSNFQDFVENDSQYTNKKIAENAELFAKWGITSFEIAPQYVSTTDGSFLDSIIQNGYAFDDRYDLAMSENNKYGSSEDLRNALSSLHAAGIQVILDWVPDQIYALTDKEVVTATRVNNYGVTTPDTELVNKLYVANSKSSGEDLQAKYGGEFLEKLQELYPSLFTDVMISTGQTIDASVKIKQWKAEYLNGTNILGRGAEYVLSDSGKYFTVTADGSFLPAQLTGDTSAQTGFYYDGTGMSYYSTSGNRVTSGFVTYNGNKYYFNEDGYLVVGAQEIDGYNYYFLPNGILLTDAIVTDETGTSYYYGTSGKRSTTVGWNEVKETAVDELGQSVTTSNWRYYYEDSALATGFSEIDGTTKYFMANGYQVKGKFITAANGKLYYFDADSGNMATNKFANDGDKWYYFDETGAAVTGEVTVDGTVLYFDENGVQVKGQFVTDENGNVNYFDANSGAKAYSKFITTGDNNWYYFNSRGNRVTGQYTISGKVYLFGADGKQVKGFTTDANGNTLYFDVNSGVKVVGKFFSVGDNWYYADANGYVVTGAQTVKGQNLYFDENGVQVKGQTVTDASGNLTYYDANSGVQVRNKFVLIGENDWYYFGENGVAVTGFQTINGQYLYFEANGVQVKGRFFSVGDDWYYADNDGNVVRGAQTINGQSLYFDENGKQVKGSIVTDSEGKVRYYDANSGELVTNKFVRVGDNDWYYFGADGVALTGAQTVYGQQLYFAADGKQVKGDYVSLGNGMYAFYDADSGRRVYNAWVTLADGTRIYVNRYGITYK
ncbi:glycoside hydrolase family 70 protein [Streptococcus loxodontisalivarius]|uniref:dextransucrase n=1 Tax=Streptococcus loxodontisalivarius TaxID=1349415 RepID=A0ABS2PSE5_9STRE|nr:glycoside hydrolase family 70 protein [Streptococcus loxodontisalivarius]MBM7642307.1 dextransucrase [Streptococcus loxodontisalivarius]